MPSLLGTAPNQVSVNSDLGKLAFMDVVDTVTNNPYLDTAISDTKPSLLLDFANSKTLDPRITYTRASTASYYDGKTTAVAEQNLLTYSQDFDNASWIKLRSTVTGNTATAPDGTLTADSLLQATGQTASGAVYYDLTCQAAPYTLSVYVKPNGKNFIRVATTLATGNLEGCYFNASTGTVGTADSGIVGTISVSTNGYYRCSITFTSNASRSGTNRIFIADSDNSSTVTDSGGVYLWGVQLEQRSSVTAYTPTTSSPITNYIPALQTAAAGVPRFDHDPVTGESKGFLIEEQRSNLQTYSEDFANAVWAATRSSVVSNTLIAPDGNLTADKLVEDTSVGTHNIRLVTGATITSGTTLTASAYVKAAERKFVCIGISDSGSSNLAYNIFDLTTGASTYTTGAVTNVTAPSSAIGTYVGNGWWRLSLTCTVTSTAAKLWIMTANSAIGYSYTGDGYSGLYIWGAQLEAGSFATSYIPTTSAQVTRSADAASITGANFSSWYRQDEGTLYGEWNTAAFTTRPITVNDGTSNNTIGLTATASTAGSDTYKNGTYQGAGTVSGTFLAGVFYKQAVGYRLNDAMLSFNGTNATVDTSYDIPVVNQLLIGQGRGGSTQVITGCIKKISYYPKRLSNAELQEMTL